jgi:hypothetical protein
MIGCPQCSLYTTALMLLHVYESLCSQKCSNDGEESGALNSPEHFSQESHYIHDKMIDASPCTGPTNIHEYVPEVDVSIIMNSEELFEEQDEIMDMTVDSNVMIFSPIEKALQYGDTPAPTQGRT